jgi:UDP-2,4-diacetamido-2,4,6-trideoxy-beta-L-altropyranose hydrolase
MKVYFRVDASVHIGSGHVMRCLSFAESLKATGHEVFFVMRPQAGDLCDYTESRGFKVARLPMARESELPRDSDDYQAWLQVSILDDAENFLSVAFDAELIVIDHYGISAQWEKHVKSSIGCKQIAIDDLVRNHSADLILDQTFGRQVKDYRLSSPGSEVLVGSRYALLRPRFSELHSFLVRKEVNFEHHKLLLTMGGVDKLNVTQDVLVALSCRTLPIHTTVLLNRDAPHFPSVASFCRKHKEWITHLSFSEDMAGLMMEHTVSIGAPGSTSWERACIGLPCVMIPSAKNQIEICERLVNEGGALSLEMNQIPELLNKKLDELMKRHSTIRRSALNLCDGKGVERVVEKLSLLGWI